MNEINLLARVWESTEPYAISVWSQVDLSLLKGAGMQLDPERLW